MFSVRFFKQAVAAGAAAAVVSVGMAMSAQATELGYGQLIGTWQGNISGGDETDINAPGPAGQRDFLESLIREAWDGDPNGPQEPFTSLGLGGDPDPLVNNLQPAGKVDSSGDGQGGRLSIDADAPNSEGEIVSGSWHYLTQAEAGTTPPPTDEVVDLYLLIGYNNYFSVFYYGMVDPLDDDRDSGLYSIGDPTLHNTTFCSGAFIQANPGSLCILGNFNNPNFPNGKPFEVSHIEAYWPRLVNGDVPEPATLALFGVGLIGLGVLRRRRRTA